MLQARSEKGEERSNPTYQEFQDGLAPGKVGARREVIKPVFPGGSGQISSRQGRSKERRDPTRPTRRFRIQAM